MKYAKPILAVAFVTAFSAGAALSQSRPSVAHPPAQQETVGGVAGAEGTQAPGFAELANGKRFISRGDLPKDNDSLKTLRAHFNEADKNHDGKLDQGEYDSQVHPAPAAGN